MKPQSGVIYLFIIAALALGLIFTLITRPKKTENNIADIIKIDQSPPKVIKDKEGKIHIQKEVIELAASQKALFQKQIDSLTKQLGLKDKQIVGITTAAGSSNLDFKPEVTAKKDTANNILGMNINYASRWFDLTGTIDLINDKLIPRDFNAKHRDSITAAFFKKNGKRYVDFSSANKDMVYENIRSWEVPDDGKKSRFGFGGTVGPGVWWTKEREVKFGLGAMVGFQYRF